MRPFLAATAVWLIVVAGLIAFTEHRNHAAGIPNRGQLAAAAAAYASMQADSNGVTMLRERVVSVKLRPDGTVAAVVRMSVEGVDHKGTLDLLVVLKRSLWRGVSFQVLHTRITK